MMEGIIAQEPAFDSASGAVSQAAAAAPAMPWWQTVHAIRGLTAALISFVIVQFAFMIHVHHDYEGKYHGPFLSAYVFGLPQVELEQGQLPVCGGKVTGWDGQFYYHMANDPFARDPEVAQHMDSPSYRYQRIGVPAIAWAAARLMGQPFTSAYLYHTVQITITSIGFGILVAWLSAVDLSWCWALCWLLGGGTFFSLFKGLPDAPADGMFIAALVALMYRRLGWYSLFISIACMIREGYAVVAFVVFLASVFNRYAWNGSPGLARRFVLTALPGVLVIGWMAYLAWVFELSPWSAKRSPGGLYGLPFRAFFLCLDEARSKRNIFEVRWILISVSVTICVLVSGAMTARHSLLGLCAAVYALLITCLGRIIWEDFSGHSKAITGVAICGIMLLHFEQSSFRRVALQLVLLANLMVGLERNVIDVIVAPPTFYESTAAQDQLLKAAAPTKSRQMPTSADDTSKIVWANAVKEIVKDCPWWLRPFHRSIIPLTVEVTNNSSAPWLGNRNGKDAILVGIQIHDGERLVSESRAVLPCDVLPGETVRVQGAIRAPRPAQYTLRIGLLQEGHHWFNEIGGKDVVEPITIR